MRNLFLMSVLVVLVAACGSAPEMSGPVVYLELDAEFTPNEVAWVERGAQEWRAIGFDVRSVGEPIDATLTMLPESVRDYPADMTAAIVIRIHLDPGLEADGRFAGLSSVDTRDVYLNPVLGQQGGDDRLFDLMGATAHELGHQLLHSGHLPEGKHGVMSAGDRTWNLTQDDLDFAKEMTGRDPV